jgi:hypothetical protein
MTAELKDLSVGSRQLPCVGRHEVMPLQLDGTIEEGDRFDKVALHCIGSGYFLLRCHDTVAVLAS